MKKISKTTLLFNLIAFILVLGIKEVKAGNIKNTIVAFQKIPIMFMANIVDEKGKPLEGAVARIKGREDQPLKYGQTSDKKFGEMIMSNCPTNAIIVISKPGYVTLEIRTATLYQPKNLTREELKKSKITVKMVPVKQGNKPAVVSKKKM